MKLIEQRIVSAESIRSGFITHEDPLGDDVPVHEGYRRAQQKGTELAGYATLFGEIPTFPAPDQGREILTREGFRHVHDHARCEIWYDDQGIVASLRVSGDQAVINFRFQTLNGVCPIIFGGSRTPVSLANGDIVHQYEIHADPGVIRLIRMARPFALRTWRVSSRFNNIGVIAGLTCQGGLTEFRPTIPLEKAFTLAELMQLSGEEALQHGTGAMTTTSGHALRFWFKPFQAAISFIAKDHGDASLWLDFYLRLAEHAHANKCWLTERNALELQLTGKLCCSSQSNRSLKVQLRKGVPAILDYCAGVEPELPASVLATES